MALKGLMFVGTLVAGMLVFVIWMGQPRAQSMVLQHAPQGNLIIIQDGRSWLAPPTAVETLDYVSPLKSLLRGPEMSSLDQVDVATPAQPLLTNSAYRSAVVVDSQLTRTVRCADQ